MISDQITLLTRGMTLIKLCVYIPVCISCDPMLVIIRNKLRVWGSPDITFDNTVTPALFTVVQQASAAGQQDNYQVEQSFWAQWGVLKYSVGKLS